MAQTCRCGHARGLHWREGGPALRAPNGCAGNLALPCPCLHFVPEATLTFQPLPERVPLGLRKQDQSGLPGNVTPFGDKAYRPDEGSVVSGLALPQADGAA